MASNAKSETSDSRYSIRELSSKGLQKLLRVSPKHQGHLHHEDPSLRHTLPENEEHKCDLETCEPPKPQNNPFLKVVNKDAAVEDAVEHMTTILDESENQFNEQRHPDCEKKINKVRAAFTDSYSAVEKISELSKLGIETAAVVSQVSIFWSQPKEEFNIGGSVRSHGIAGFYSHQRIYLDLEGKIHCTRP